MRRRYLISICATLATIALWFATPSTAHAQLLPDSSSPLPRYYYYPYYYFPHNYWPTMSPKWPESPGQPYQRPPAYMAYPPFLEPHWRYEEFTPQRFYKGFHFWLDQF
jgi:Gpi18-like mannosyltransferase